MLKTLYIIVALISSMLCVSLFGYGIAHGGTFFYLVLPICLGIFVIPLFLEKRLTSRGAVTLVYGIPLLLLASPMAFLFFFNPWYEGYAGEKALEAITVTIAGEELIKNKKGDVLGLKIITSYNVPENTPYMGELEKLTEYASFPTPQIQSLKRPPEQFDLSGGFNVYVNKDGKILREPKIGMLNMVKMKPGTTYTIESWRLPSFVRIQDDKFCKSKKFDQTGEVSKVLSFSKQSFEVHLDIMRVLKSYRMGYFDHLFPLTYTTENELSGENLRKTIETLPRCGEKAELGLFIPKEDLSPLYDF